MGRKPADAVAAARFPQGRPVIWRAIRKLAKTGPDAVAGFTLTEISKQCGDEMPWGTIETYVKSLVAAGILSRTRAGKPGIPAIYFLDRDPGAEAPRLRRDGSPVTMGSAQESIWRTIRMQRGVFASADIALTANTDEYPVAELAVVDYLKYMLHAGYVAVARPAARGKRGKALYRFVRARDPGPLAPQIQRVKAVFDPNTGTVVWTSAKNAEDEA
jgi:hypothetical protein